MISRRSFLRTLSAAAASSACPAALRGESGTRAHPWASAGSGSRPNIILVLCDDLGWGDLGTFWQAQRKAPHKLLTPNLDRAAAEGVKLTQHLTVSPICIAARASLMTGKNQGHCNVRDSRFDHAIDPHMTLATVLKAGGYATWHLGKWGIGGGYQAHTPRTAMPGQAGFDYAYGYPAHLHGHSYYHCFIPGTTDIDRADKLSPILESYSEAAYAAAGSPEGFLRDQEPGAKTAQFRRPVPNKEVRFVYDTDLFTAKAKQLIGAHQKTAPAQPFFLQLCYTTVHGSGHAGVCDPAITHKAVFHVPGTPYPALSDEDPEWGGGATLSGASKATAQTANTWIHPDARAFPTPSLRRYATSVRRLDDAMGDLLHFLKLRGLDQNTLLVFTSDNGPSGEYLTPGGLKWVEEAFDSNGPFKGMKRWSYEGGLREPTFARWPGILPAGKTSNLPSNFTCWMPTFADAAGLPPPAHADGVSLLPELTGTGRQLPCRLYTEYIDSGTPEHFGLEQSVRHGSWVLLRNSGKNQNTPELYNLDDDPGQTRNLAAQRPDLVRQLLPLLVTCRIPTGKVPDACGAPTAVDAGGKARRALDETPFPALDDALPTPQAAAWLYQGTWPWVPDFRTLMPVHEVPETRLAAILPKLPKQHIGLLRHGCLTLEEPAVITFEAHGGGGCQLWVHEAHILEYEAGDCADAPRRFTLALEKGRHPWRAALTAPLVALRALTPDGRDLFAPAGQP